MTNATSKLLKQLANIIRLPEGTKLFNKTIGIHVKEFLSSKNHDNTPKCNYCGETNFFEGPSGGICVNVMCSNPQCGHWFNFDGIKLNDLYKVGNNRKPTIEKIKHE